MLLFLCIAGTSAENVNDTTLKTGTDTIKSTDLNGAATDNSKAINADNEIIGVSSENDTATEGDVFNMQYNYKYDASADRGLNVGSKDWVTKQVTINGNGYTIDGSMCEKIRFNNLVGFNDVTFMNLARAQYTMENVDVNFINCNFTKCSGFRDTNGIINKVTGCNFFNILLSTTVSTGPVIQGQYVVNCSFKNITSFVSNNDMMTATHIINCTFEECDCVYTTGGTVNNGYNMYIEDSIFINCNGNTLIAARLNTGSSPNTGRLYVNNCKFINNTLSKGHTGTRTTSEYLATVFNNCVFYLNKNVRIFPDVNTNYCSAFNNTIIAGDYSMDSDVEDSVINFNYSGLSSSVSASRADLVTSRFDNNESFIYVNSLPTNNQKFDLVVKDINGSVVLNSSVVSDENGKGSFDCSSLDMGNYTYTVYHDTYHTISDSGLLWLLIQ